MHRKDEVGGWTESAWRNLLSVGWPVEGPGGGGWDMIKPVLWLVSWDSGTEGLELMTSGAGARLLQYLR